MMNKVELCGVNTSKLPLLREDEKEELFRRIQKGDEKAREEYIKGNLRLVLSVIKRFDSSSESADDLFQIGCVGLMKAVDNFDPERLVRFSTYAVPMIVGEIRRYLRDNSSIRVSRSLRDTAYKAIYAKELNDPIELSLTDIDISKEDGKKIVESISKQLPMFCLFESDRKNTDKDAEIQDPLKAVTKSVISDMEDQITQMQEEVKQKVEEIGRKTIKKLSELDSSIAQNIQPKVTLKPIDSSFSFDLVSDNDIPLNKRGSGVRRLILLSYFRADAEEKLRENDNRQMIYAIEEPETSQHPDYQRMILSTLLELSEKDTHQIIVTSHTPEIAKMVDVNQLIFIKKDEHGMPHIERNDMNKIKGIAESLGILPYAKTKTVVYVEGPNDVNFLTAINHNIPELKDIVDLSDNDFSLIPLNGGHLIDWVNKDYFSESPIKEIYIVDNDVEKYVKLIETIQKEDDGRRFGWHTKLLEMENYIAPELIEDQFDIDLSKYKDTWFDIDVPKTLLNLVNPEIKDAKKREVVIKQILNQSVSKKITKDILVKMNCWDELEGWFKRIRDINNGTYVKKKIIY